MQPDYSKSQRMEARATLESKNLIKHAAALQGRDVSEFLIACAEKEARKVIKEMEILVLSKQDRRLFVQALLADEKPSARLKSSMKNFLKHKRK